MRGELSFQDAVVAIGSNCVLQGAVLRAEARMGRAAKKQAWDGDTDFESMTTKLSLQAADFTAKAKYKKAHEKVLELALAYRNYEFQLVEKDNKKMALAQFQKAAEMDKSTPEASKAAGDLLREMGKPKTAINYYKEGGWSP